MFTVISMQALNAIYSVCFWKPFVGLQYHGLPQELVDMIIDQLHNDRDALSVCALVCRSWLPTARVHLFGSIALAKRTDFANLIGLLDGSPVLTGSVHTITIYGDLPFSLGADTYEWLGEAFKVMSRLEKVKKIRWWAVDWGVVECVLRGCPYTLPQVPELCADGVRFASVENIVSFFRTSTNVTSLSLHDIHVTDLEPSNMPSLFTHSRPRLRRLSLMNNGTNGPLVDLLLLSQFELDLRSLHMAWTPQLGSLVIKSRFQTLLGAVASTVQELLVVMKCNPPEALVKYLGSFSQLRLLTFIFEDPKSDQAQLCTWLYSALSELPRSLEQIVLKFNTPSCSLARWDTSTSGVEHWKPIDVWLSNAARFPNLTCFSMQGILPHHACSGPTEPAQKARQIADFFPSLVETGLLRVFGGTDDSRVLLFP